MKLIDSKVELLPWVPGLEGVYKNIELAGRVCYKSENKITENSAKNFVDRMVASNHIAMLEHGTIYLMIPLEEWGTEEDYKSAYWADPHTKTNEDNIDWYNYEGYVCITTNLRVIHENGWLDDLKFLCDPTEYHETRYSFRFICDRAMAQELTRHRAFSFAMESQRYCNYSKGKFGNEITFIQPAWDTTLNPDQYGKDESLPFFLNEVEILYKHLTKDCGWQPQRARIILPNCTKTELVMTGFASDWKHLLDLRYFEKTGKVDPNMKDLMEKLRVVAEKNGIWENITK